jgi:hypothetical protein
MQPYATREIDPWTQRLITESRFASCSKGCPTQPSGPVATV